MWAWLWLVLDTLSSNRSQFTHFLLIFPTYHFPALPSGYWIMMNLEGWPNGILCYALFASYRSSVWNESIQLIAESNNHFYVLPFFWTITHFFLLGNNNKWIELSELYIQCVYLEEFRKILCSLVRLYRDLYSILSLSITLFIHSPISITSMHSSVKIWLLSLMS